MRLLAARKGKRRMPAAAWATGSWVAVTLPAWVALDDRVRFALRISLVGAGTILAACLLLAAASAHRGSLELLAKAAERLTGREPPRQGHPARLARRG